MSEEHIRNEHLSNREKHQKSQARKRRDASGEKGDVRRKTRQNKRNRPQQEQEG